MTSSSHTAQAIPPHRPIRATAGGLLSLSALAKALNALRHSGLVLLPSDTCYALAADPRDTRALCALRLALDRGDAFLSVSMPTLDQLRIFADIGTGGRRLAGALFPGPLTITAEMTDFAREHFGSNLSPNGMLGGRITDSPIEAQISAAYGWPLTTTAIRDDRGEEVRNLADAWAIVERGLDLVGELVGFLPLLCVIEGGGFNYCEHSTVISIDRASSRLSLLRPGAYEWGDVQRASRKLGPYDYDDGT